MIDHFYRQIGKGEQYKLIFNNTNSNRQLDMFAWQFSLTGGPKQLLDLKLCLLRASK